MVSKAERWLGQVSNSWRKLIFRLTSLLRRQSASNQPFTCVCSIGCNGRTKVTRRYQLELLLLADS